MGVATEEPDASTSQHRPSREIKKQELAEILERHRLWIETQGEVGEQADLSRANLAVADLTDANLRGAFLNKANLKGADLMLADLESASLIQANLQEANLLGIRLREANLQGANLDGATGLLAGQLAGANLFGATLPQPLSEFEGLQHVARVGSIVSKLLAAIVLVNFFSWLLIAATTDVQLVINAPALALPLVGNALPTASLYLLAPMLLFGFYLYFHFYSLRLWEGLADLPAVFPNGHWLDKSVPWFVMGLARRHFKRLRENRPPLSSLETAISLLLGYWVVPATLILFWARHLTRQDLRGTALHVFLVVATIAFAMSFPDLVGRKLRPDEPRSQNSKEAKEAFGLAKGYRHSAIALGVGLLLSLLSVGAIEGAPHAASRAPELKTLDIRRWAADIFWLIGYSPYADLTEAIISPKPANWTGRDDDIGPVKGVRLNRLSLRYGEAYRAFLVNARLWEADLQSAYLSEADLRGAALRRANLRSAVLDRARIDRADLERADLQKANLTRADAREANLSFASLAGALLVDTRLGGANLYAANLRAASLLRANLEKADLREAILEDARLALAELQEAYLWSAKLRGAQLQDAKLERAILLDADLRGTDLRGADLQGAVLRGADLTGANLEGADVRSAVGLTAAQLCSAVERRGVQMDEDLLNQVEGRCGSTDSQGTQRP